MIRAQPEANEGDVVVSEVARGARSALGSIDVGRGRAS